MGTLPYTLVLIQACEAVSPPLDTGSTARSTQSLLSGAYRYLDVHVVDVVSYQVTSWGIKYSVTSC